MNFQCNIDFLMQFLSFQQLDGTSSGNFKLQTILFSLQRDSNEKDFAKPFNSLEKNGHFQNDKIFETSMFSPGVQMSFSLNQFCAFRLESNCLNGFNKFCFVEISLMAKSGKPDFLKKYPPNSDGYSKIESCIVQISNPHDVMSEYTEVIFKKVIFCHLKFLIFSSISGYNFFKQLKLQNQQNQKIIQRDILQENDNLILFLRTITQKKGKYLDEFKSYYVGRLVSAAKKLFMLTHKYISQFGGVFPPEKNKKLAELKFRMEKISANVNSLSKDYAKIASHSSFESFNQGEESRNIHSDYHETSIFNRKISENLQAPTLMKNIDAKKSLNQTNDTFSHPIDAQKAQFDIFFRKTMEQIDAKKGKSIQNIETRLIVPTFPNAFQTSEKTLIHSNEALHQTNLDEIFSILKTIIQNSNVTISETRGILTELIQTIPSILEEFLHPDFHRYLKTHLFMNVISKSHNTHEFHKNIIVYANKSKIADETRRQNGHNQIEISRVESVGFFKTTSKMPIFFEENFENEIVKKTISPNMPKIFNETFDKFLKTPMTISRPKPETGHFPKTQINAENEKTSAKKLFTPDIKNQFSQKVDQKSVSKNRHLVIFVHGYGGSDTDMRFLKNYTLTLFPELICLMSNVNADSKESSISVLGKNLAIEIRDFLNSCGVLTIDKISFVAHSLGGLVVRSSFLHLPDLSDRFYTFISLATPHIGFTNHHSKMAQAGFSIFKNFGKEKILNELDFSDTKDPRQSFLYKIAFNGGLAHFKNIILVSSGQDNYCPQSSARIQVNEKSRQNESESDILNEMAEAIFKNFRGNIIKRIDIDIVDNAERVVDWVTGRTAHVDLISDPMIILTILLLSKNSLI